MSARTMMRSLTGVFGVSTRVLEQLLGIEEEITRRGSQAPPPPSLPPAPAASSDESGVRPAVRLPDDDEEPEPVTVDLRHPGQGPSAG